jgi:hypothetical protein
MYVSASQTYSSESRYVRLEAVIGVPKVVRESETSPGRMKEVELLNGLRSYISLTRKQLL